MNQRFRVPFFWRPNGAAVSLAGLKTSDAAVMKDVTLAVTGENPGSHLLIVAELAGGKIIDDLRLAATADDIVIDGLQSIFGCAAANDHYLLRRRRLRINRFWRGRALLLGSNNNDNYYHWLLDSVPRWKMIQEAGWRDYDFVLLHRQPSRVQDELLDRLKVPAAKRLRCKKYCVHQFEKLVVPAMPFPPEEVPAWTCAWLRSLFSHKIPGPEKIYLSRNGGNGRRLANEEELEAALLARGFVSVQPEKMPVAEQAKLLSSARCVVAPHGAALANLIFAPRGALLFELFHPQHKNRCYVNLAAACGHRYASLDGCAINHAKKRQLEYTVDVLAVLKILEEKGHSDSPPRTEIFACKRQWLDGVHATL